MRIALFLPYNAIWDFAFPAALVGEMLVKHGHEVVYIGCNGEYQSFCQPLYYDSKSHDTPLEEKQRLCEACIARRKLITEAFPFRYVALESLLTDEERRDCVRRSQALTMENYLEAEIGGLPIASYALYEICLAFKKSPPIKLNSMEFERLRAILLNAMKTHAAIDRFMKTERIDRVLLSCGLYANERVVCEYASRSSVPAYFMHGGWNWAKGHQTLVVARDNVYANLARLKQLWETQGQMPASQEEIRAVVDHYLALFEGNHSHAFSKPKEKGAVSVRKHFGIPEASKIALATMSSYDEVFASQITKAALPEKLIFETQLDWLKSLVAFFRDRPDLFLIIRVHPREFRRDIAGRRAEHLSSLEKLFLDLPANVKANTPDDELSLYDLMNEVSLGLNSFSTASEELGLLGIPTLSYARTDIFYPGDIDFYANSTEEYFKKLDEALAAGWSFERARRFFRWRSLFMERTVLDLSGSYRHNNSGNRKPPVWARALRKARRMVNPFGREKKEVRRRKSVLPEHDVLAREISEALPSLAHTRDYSDRNNPKAYDAETDALKTELGRLYRRMFGSKAAPNGAETLQKNLYRAIQR